MSLQNSDGSHLVSRQGSPVGERDGHVRVIRAQHLLADGQGTLKQGTSLVQPSLECDKMFPNKRVEITCVSAEEQVVNNTTPVVERCGRTSVIRTENLLVNRLTTLMEWFCLGELALT